MGHSPRGHKESDTTERLHFHFTVPDGVAEISFLSELRHFLSDVLTRKIRVRDVSRSGKKGGREH